MEGIRRVAMFGQKRLSREGGVEIVVTIREKPDFMRVYAA